MQFLKTLKHFNDFFYLKKKSVKTIKLYSTYYLVRRDLVGCCPTIEPPARFPLVLAFLPFPFTALLFPFKVLAAAVAAFCSIWSPISFSTIEIKVLQRRWSS